MTAARIVAVCPRDGMQNKPRPVSTPTKIELVEPLLSGGLKTVEATAFVSPNGDGGVVGRTRT